MSKRILWASLTLMLFISLIAGVKATVATVYVEPQIIAVFVGETFNITINIKGVSDLYSWEFKLDYPAYEWINGEVEEIMTFIEAYEGDFLTAQGSTFFTYTFDPVEGIIVIGCTLLGDIPGASGDGTLATIEFKALHPYEGDLILYDVKLLDSDLIEMPSEAIGAKIYIGPEKIPWRAILWITPKPVGGKVWPEMPTISPGDKQRCYARVRNSGNASCYFTVYFEVYHETGGLKFRLWPVFGMKIPEATIDPGPDGELFTEDDELIDPGSAEISTPLFRVKRSGTYYIKAYVFASGVGPYGPWTSWEELEEEYGGEGTSAIIGTNYFRVS